MKLHPMVPPEYHHPNKRHRTLSRVNGSDLGLQHRTTEDQVDHPAAPPNGSGLHNIYSCQRRGTKVGGRPVE